MGLRGYLHGYVTSIGDVVPANINEQELFAPCIHSRSSCLPSLPVWAMPELAPSYYQSLLMPVLQP